MDARIAQLRIFAFLLVVLLHVSASQALSFGDGWWAANIYDSFSRICVPIFLMLSGTLLLKKSEPLAYFVKKRLSKILLPLIFWSCFYLGWLSYNGVPLGNWLLSIISGPTMYHLWYLYALIGLYALVPVLRRFYQNSTQAEKVWFIALWLFVGSLWPTLAAVANPQACSSLRTTDSATIYNLGYFGGYAGYMVLGAVISELKISRLVSLAIYLGSSAATSLLMYWQSTRLGRPCETFYEYMSPLVILAASAMFTFFLSAPKSPTSKAVAVLSDCTFGAYCLHVIIIGAAFPYFGWVPHGSTTWISAPIIAISGFAGSIFLIYLFRLSYVGRLVT